MTERVPDPRAAASPATPFIDPLGEGARYRALRLLGRGGMGEVYEAVHVALGHRVVVKIIRAELANRTQMVERMRLEAQSLARLQHPNLVRVTDFDVTAAGQPFFVMEYLDGRSLGEELAARGRLPLEQALDIAVQALEGLAVAHQAGVVHRDIKPDNIFLCAASQAQDAPALHVKVLDFGVAKLVGSASGADTPLPLAAPTAPGKLIGTPRYAAPEQALARPLDGRVDIYAMGLVLYVMLTGRGPFDDEPTAIEIVRAHLTRIPDPPSSRVAGLAPAIDAVVLRCLAKRPEERFASARELVAALRAAQTAPPALPPTVPFTPAPRGAPANARNTAAPVAAVARPVPVQVAVAPAPPVRSVAPSPALAPAAAPHVVAAPGTTGSTEHARRLPVALVIGLLLVVALLSSFATHALWR